MKIYPRKMFKNIISILFQNYEYLGTGDMDELAFKEKETGNFIILTFDHEYIYIQ